MEQAQCNPVSGGDSAGEADGAGAAQELPSPVPTADPQKNREDEVFFLLTSPAPTLPCLPLRRSSGNAGQTKDHNGRDTPLLAPPASLLPTVRQGLQGGSHHLRMIITVCK